MAYEADDQYRYKNPHKPEQSITDKQKSQETAEERYQEQIRPIIERLRLEAKRKYSAHLLGDGE